MIISLFSTLVLFFFLFFSIAVHEFGHALLADRLGDPTPKLQGRLTLNPLAHIDLYGTVLVPLLLIITGSPFIFGWAKPVVFDPYNLRDPKKDAGLISLAGPIANITFASLLAIVFRLLNNPFSPIYPLIEVVPTIVTLNLVLAVFNLIPIHPLDGGKILVGLLPTKDAPEVDRFLHRYGVILLILILIPWTGTSPIFMILSPVIRFLSNLLLPQAGLI